MPKLLILTGALCAAAVAVLLVNRARSDRPTNDRFDWLPGDSAPKDFPIEVIRGDFHFEDRDPLYVPDHRVVDVGWGQVRSTHVVGETFKPLPKRLTLTWFSYREDCFYSGDFELPYAELLRLFREGYASPNTGEPETYHRIIVGMAPEGEVALWVAGGGIIREVATYKAETVVVPFTDLLDNPDVSRAEYIAMVMQDSFDEERAATIGQEPIPKGLYPRLHRRSPWQVTVTGDAAPESIRIAFTNGEAECIDWKKAPDALRSRAVPITMRLNWRKPDGVGRSVHATFDMDEVRARLVSDDPNSAPKALRIDVQDDEVTFSVAGPDGSGVALERVEAKVYRTD